MLCDRFIDSTRAYQGGAGGLSDDEILALHGVGSEGLMPDRTLVLGLPTTDANARTLVRDGGEPDRFGAKNSAYHQRVAAAFDVMAAQEPARIKLVSGEGAAHDVTARLLTELADLL